MSPLSKDSIHRVATTQKGEHWFPSPAKLLKGAPNPGIAARSGESFLQRLNRFRLPSGRLIDFSQVQAELGMIAEQLKPLQTKPLGFDEPPFAKGREQASLGKIERLRGGALQSAPEVDRIAEGVES